MIPRGSTFHMKKVLIIDDEEHYCRALKKGLEMKGNFQVLTATRGEEGIRIAKQQKPDIILLDIVMPDMAGTVVAEALSNNPVTANIPIIFVTAIVQHHEVSEGGGVVGGQIFVAKPIMMDDMINKIKAI